MFFTTKSHRILAPHLHPRKFPLRILVLCHSTDTLLPVVPYGFQNTWYGRNPYLSAVVQSFGRIFFSTEFANSRFSDANDHTIISSFITSKSSGLGAVFGRAACCRVGFFLVVRLDFKFLPDKPLRKIRRLQLLLCISFFISSSGGSAEASSAKLCAPLDSPETQRPRSSNHELPSSVPSV